MGAKQVITLSWAESDRFWSKVLKIPFTDCWLWSGALNSSGNPVFKFRKVTTTAQKVMYLITHGPIEKNSMVRRLCGQKLCVKPEHLVKMSIYDKIEDFTLPD